MKIWMLPSYKSDTPSSQMRVYKIAPLLSLPTEIIPHNLSLNEKHEILKNTKTDDFILIQKWRTEFNSAEHIQKIKGIKIFDMDDICEDQNVIDLINVSDILFVANHYLLNWAKKFNKPTYLVPTGIDIPENLTPYNKNARPNIIIAKYGVDKYIQPISRIPGWQKLFEKHNIAMRILGTTNNTRKTEAQTAIGHFVKTYNLVPFSSFWEKYGKIISTATVGIMPLGKSAQGKSAFSVLTMMAAGLPVIASPYGECDYIINSGINGYLANTKDDWFNACDTIISDNNLRQKMSVEAIKTIVRTYTVDKIAKTIEKSLGLI